MADILISGGKFNLAAFCLNLSNLKSDSASEPHNEIIEDITLLSNKDGQRSAISYPTSLAKKTANHKILREFL